MIYTMIFNRMRRNAVYIGLALFLWLILGHLIQSTPPSPLNFKGPGLSNILPHHQQRVNGTPVPFPWDQRPADYPVEYLTPLPTAPARNLPKVQHSFKVETDDFKVIRLERQKAVYDTFQRCWTGYKSRAFGHDELTPISGGVQDGFGGWAATAVDALDTLWIMGMKDEFNLTVQKVLEIDLGRVTLESINIFETTIRHLGGLLAAYDLSEDERLLDKAREFGEMLLVPFDTPNHLPITRWDPLKAVKKGSPQEASPSVLIAEIGSLSLEFTRLSQLTNDTRWYDAVDRIMRLLAAQQDSTQLKGMWPVNANARDADFTKDTYFTLGAMADSVYEYLPKMHALLGGAETMYKKMYEASMKTAIRYNIFRPMLPDSADVLFSGAVRARDWSEPALDPQGQHLACFAGGMFALGGKLTEKEGHVEIGRRLTNGCIWAYRNTGMGIMPEVFEMVPCASRAHCRWNSTRYYEAVESSHPGKLTAAEYMEEKRLKPGFVRYRDSRYLLRPEAIESVFILYRVTGEEWFLDAAWEMFRAIEDATTTELASAALSDVTYTPEELVEKRLSVKVDSMESFWMAETLKYFYLIFSEPSVIDLDEWVLNTEAHPFRRPPPEVGEGAYDHY